MMLDLLSRFLWNLCIYTWDHYLRPLTTLNGNLLQFSFYLFQNFIFKEMIISCQIL